MYYANGGRVAQFDSPEAVFPSELHFSGEGDVFPVHLFYEDDDDGRAFAKGGLARNAMSVKHAGRYGDTEIVHMNKDELEELKHMWGEPTINPHTGQPEFFLKGLWRGVKKVAKPLAQIAPIAAMFIPGIGPLAAAAIGAVSGGITGGWKGALMGGALGGFGGALGKGIQGGLKIANPVLSRAAAGALIGGGASALTGGNALKGALMGGATAGAIGPGGLINPSAGAYTPPTSTPSDIIASANQPTFNPSAPVANSTGDIIVRASQPTISTPPFRHASFDTSSLNLSPTQSAAFNRALETGLNGSSMGRTNFDFGNAGLSPNQMSSLKPIIEQGLNNAYSEAAATGATAANGIDYLNTPVDKLLSRPAAGVSAAPSGVDYINTPIEKLITLPSSTAGVGGPEVAATNGTAASAKAPNFWNQKALEKYGIGIKNKYLIGGALGAAALADAMRKQPSNADTMDAREKFFGKDFFSGTNSGGGSGFRLASLGSPIEAYQRDYLSGYAGGGDVHRSGGRKSFAVQGPGDGRSDDIPAMLSDGEYVIDAETVALLGNGSPKAGADKLDDLRVQIRKHKGRKLAKGKISPDAKPALRYMAGGRI